MHKLKFRCPECGFGILSVSQKSLEYVEILRLDPESCYLEQGKVLDGWIEEYCSFGCHQCGYEIGNTEDEAALWLIKNNMIEEQADVG